MAVALYNTMTLTSLQWYCISVKSNTSKQKNGSEV